MSFFKNIFGSKSTKELRNITSNQIEEDDWVDLIFDITESRKIENGVWTLVCKANFEHLIVVLDYLLLTILNLELIMIKLTTLSLFKMDYQ